ncbi:hypothetical protein BESB_008140 [Besnoitia besnoiti]|uniref:Uncharacterized protein n=1 Tax=Besnoitia besnoiti TaxID=94643 RepID=A0A2A9MQU0_BESBE|nr:hypothetical protein BESB_008140 [Besnoitia besnoiti]PFH38472.1 hypothetical protein BESB_008140 [Besnoitia besnoiti]
MLQWREVAFPFRRGTKRGISRVVFAPPARAQGTRKSPGSRAAPLGARAEGREGERLRSDGLAAAPTHEFLCILVEGDAPEGGEPSHAEEGLRESDVQDWRKNAEKPPERRDAESAAGADLGQGERAGALPAVEVFDIKHGVSLKWRATSPTVPTAPTCAAFSPDASILAVGCRCGSILLFLSLSGECVARRISSAAVAPPVCDVSQRLRRALTLPEREALALGALTTAVGGESGTRSRRPEGRRRQLQRGGRRATPLGGRASCRCGEVSQCSEDARASDAEGEVLFDEEESACGEHRAAIVSLHWVDTASWMREGRDELREFLEAVAASDKPQPLGVGSPPGEEASRVSPSALFLSAVSPSSPVAPPPAVLQPPALRLPSASLALFSLDASGVGSLSLEGRLPLFRLRLLTDLHGLANTSPALAAALAPSPADAPALSPLRSLAPRCARADRSGARAPPAAASCRATCEEDAAAGCGGLRRASAPQRPAAAPACALPRLAPPESLQLFATASAASSFSPFASTPLSPSCATSLPPSFVFPSPYSHAPSPMSASAAEASGSPRFQRAAGDGGKAAEAMPQETAACAGRRIAFTEEEAAGGAAPRREKRDLWKLSEAFSTGAAAAAYGDAEKGERGSAGGEENEKNRLWQFKREGLEGGEARLRGATESVRDAEALRTLQRGRGQAAGQADIKPHRRPPCEVAGDKTRGEPPQSTKGETAEFPEQRTLTAAARATGRGVSNCGEDENKAVTSERMDWEAGEDTEGAAETRETPPPRVAGRLWGVQSAAMSPDLSSLALVLWTTPLLASPQRPSPPDLGQEAQGPASPRAESAPQEGNRGAARPDLRTGVRPFSAPPGCAFASSVPTASSPSAAAAASGSTRCSGAALFFRASAAPGTLCPPSSVARAQERRERELLVEALQPQSTLPSAFPPLSIRAPLALSPSPSTGAVSAAAPLSASPFRRASAAPVPPSSPSELARSSRVKRSPRVARRGESGAAAVACVSVDCAGRTEATEPAHDCGGGRACENAFSNSNVARGRGPEGRLEPSPRSKRPMALAFEGDERGSERSPDAEGPRGCAAAAGRGSSPLPQHRRVKKPRSDVGDGRGDACAAFASFGAFAAAAACELPSDSEAAGERRASPALAMEAARAPRNARRSGTGLREATATRRCPAVGAGGRGEREKAGEQEVRADGRGGRGWSRDHATSEEEAAQAPGFFVEMRVVSALAGQPRLVKGTSEQGEGDPGATGEAKEGGASWDEAKAGRSSAACWTAEVHDRGLAAVFDFSQLAFHSRCRTQSLHLLAAAQADLLFAVDVLRRVCSLWAVFSAPFADLLECMYTAADAPAASAEPPAGEQRPAKGHGNSSPSAFEREREGVSEDDAEAEMEDDTEPATLSSLRSEDGAIMHAAGRAKRSEARRCARDRRLRQHVAFSLALGYPTNALVAALTRLCGDAKWRASSDDETAEAQRREGCMPERNWTQDETGKRLRSEDDSRKDTLTAARQASEAGEQLAQVTALVHPVLEALLLPVIRRARRLACGARRFARFSGLDGPSLSASFRSHLAPAPSSSHSARDASRQPPESRQAPASTPSSRGWRRKPKSERGEDCLSTRAPAFARLLARVVARLEDLEVRLASLRLRLAEGVALQLAFSLWVAALLSHLVLPSSASSAAASSSRSGRRRASDSPHARGQTQRGTAQRAPEENNEEMPREASAAPYAFSTEIPFAAASFSKSQSEAKAKHGKSCEADAERRGSGSGRDDAEVDHLSGPRLRGLLAAAKDSPYIWRQVSSAVSSGEGRTPAPDAERLSAEAPVHCSSIQSTDWERDFEEVLRILRRSRAPLHLGNIGCFLGGLREPSEPSLLSLARATLNDMRLAWDNCRQDVTLSQGQSALRAPSRSSCSSSSFFSSSLFSSRPSVSLGALTLLPRVSRRTRVSLLHVSSASRRRASAAASIARVLCRGSGGSKASAAAAPEAACAARSLERFAICWASDEPAPGALQLTSDAGEVLGEPAPFPRSSAALPSPSRLAPRGLCWLHHCVIASRAARVVSLPVGGDARASWRPLPAACALLARPLKTVAVRLALPACEAAARASSRLSFSPSPAFSSLTAASCASARLSASLLRPTAAAEARMTLKSAASLSSFCSPLALPLAAAPPLFACSPSLRSPFARGSESLWSAAAVAKTPLPPLERFRTFELQDGDAAAAERALTAAMPAHLADACDVCLLSEKEVCVAVAVWREPAVILLRLLGTHSESRTPGGGARDGGGRTPRGREADDDYEDAQDESGDSSGLRGAEASFRLLRGFRSGLEEKGCEAKRASSETHHHTAKHAEDDDLLLAANAITVSARRKQNEEGLKTPTVTGVRGARMPSGSQGSVFLQTPVLFAAVASFAQGCAILPASRALLLPPAEGAVRPREAQKMESEQKVFDASERRGATAGKQRPPAVEGG